MKKTKIKKIPTKRKIKSRNKTSILAKLMVVFIGIASLVLIIKSLLPKPASIGINEVSPSSQASVTLSLPPTITTSLNSETSADITIDSGASSVTAVQIELVYDPSTISTPSITQGGFFTQKLTSPKIENGKISFAYAVKIEEKSKSGSGVVATLKFKPLKENAQIAFGNGTMVASIDNLDTNSLKSATGTTITTKTGNTVSTPPVLEDIEKAPVNRPVETYTPPTQKSGGSSQTTTTTTPSETRVFNETGNFDYSKNRVSNTSEDLEATQTVDSKLTGFAKFIFNIKKLFGVNNAKN
jgi:hypothetical protein